jgi:hypothetical protein
MLANSPAITHGPLTNARTLFRSNENAYQTSNPILDLAHKISLRHASPWIPIEPATWDASPVSLDTRISGLHKPIDLALHFRPGAALTIWGNKIGICSAASGDLVTAYHNHISELRGDTFRRHDGCVNTDPVTPLTSRAGKTEFLRRHLLLARNGRRSFYGSNPERS